MINCRRRAANTRPTASYSNASPTDNQDERRALEKKLSSDEKTLLIMASTDQYDDWRATEVYGNMTFSITTNDNRGAQETDICPLYRVECRRRLEDCQTVLQIPLFIIDVGFMDPRWPLRNFSSWCAGTARYATCNTISRRYVPSTANKEMNPVNMAELYGTTLYGTLIHLLNNDVNDDAYLNAVLLARTWLIWNSRFHQTKLLLMTEKKHFQSKISRALRLRDNNLSEATEYVNLQKNVHPGDWYYCLMSLAKAEPFITQRQYINGLHNIAMGPFFQYGFKAGMRVTDFRPILLRIIFERAARHVPQISLRECYDLDEVINIILTKAGNVFEGVLRNWAFIMDVIQIVFADGLIENPIPRIARLSALRNEYKNMNGIVPLCMALSPTSYVTPMVVAELIYRSVSEVGRSDQLDCSLLLGQPLETERSSIRHTLAENARRALEERKKTEEMAKIIEQKEDEPEEIKMSWDMFINVNNSHVHTNLNNRRTVKVCVRAAKDGNIPAVQSFYRLLTTPIGNTIPFGPRRLRIILSFVCSNEMIEEMNNDPHREFTIPEPDWNNRPADLDWANYDDTDIKIPVPRNADVESKGGRIEAKDVMVVDMDTAMENHVRHSAFLARLANENKSDAKARRECIVCYESTSRMKPLHPPSPDRPHEQVHVVCKECYPLIAQTHTCPLCRQTI